MNRAGNAARSVGTCTPEQHRAASSRRVVFATVWSAAVALLTLVAVWPLYDTPWVGITVGGGWLLAVLLGWAWSLLRWSGLTLLLVTLAAFCAAVVPLTVPSALRGGGAGFLTGLRTGVLGVATGWKDLLTLHVPVGDYQTVLVPVLVTVLAGTLGALLLAGSGRRAAPWAVLPLLLPLLFAPVFGAGITSDPLRGLGLTLPAPRELLVWGSWFLLALCWVAWVTGEDRREALRLGRAAAPSAAPGGSSQPPRGRGTSTSARRSVRPLRVLGGAGALALALTAGLLLTPALSAETAEQRTVPREHVDPLLVVQQHSSPLGSYRTWKQDGNFELPLFRVAPQGETPDRLRLAVLDAYDGTVFHLAAPGQGGERFTKFTGGTGEPSTAHLTVTIEEGYREPWVPLPPRAEAPPVFAGPRADELQESLYVNRATGAAIVVPEGDSLTSGESFRVPVASGGTEQDPRVGNPAPGTQRQQHGETILERMPQLAAWAEAQGQPASGEGLTELISRLRERGYLSHGLSEDNGSAWLTALQEDHGTRFVPSYAGHSEARVEELFGQLNEQERLAGEGADTRALVAAIGDDEQFAAASALLAQSLGFESRVVLGVRLGAEADLPGVPACRDLCTGEHLTAWVEVRGNTEHWTAIDVTPQIEYAPNTPTEGEQLPEYATLPQDLSLSESEPQQAQGDAEEQTSKDQEAEGEPAWFLSLLRVGGLALGALALLLLPSACPAGAGRPPPPRRRAARSPEWQAVGAWQELLDTYRDAGLAVPRTGYRGATATAIARPRAGEIARGTDQAVFGNTPFPEGEADSLWSLVAEEREELRSGLSLWRRALLALAVPTVFARREARPTEHERSGSGSE